MSTIDPYESAFPLLQKQHAGMAPQVNLPEVERLIRGAQEKIALYEQCIENDEHRLAEWHERLKPFDALTTYLERSDERGAKLLGLYRYGGDYGLPSPVAPEYLQEVAAQANALKSLIDGAKARESDLRSRIDFLREDIAQLEAIKCLDAKPRVSDQALPICS